MLLIISLSIITFMTIIETIGFIKVLNIIFR